MTQGIVSLGNSLCVTRGFAGFFYSNDVHGGKTASRVIRDKRRPQRIHGFRGAGDGFRENQDVRVFEALAAGHDGCIEIEVDGDKIGVGGQHPVEGL